MRSIAWMASGAALGVALAGFVALGSSNGAFAQGMTAMGGSPPKAKAYRPAKKAAPRVKRSYYRGALSQKTCGQYKYFSKGKCLDARTTPPKL